MILSWLEITKLKNKKAQYKGPYKIIHMCTNVIISLQIGTTTERVDIYRIKPYHTEDFHDKIISLHNIFHNKVVSLTYTYMH